MNKTIAIARKRYAGLFLALLTLGAFATNSYAVSTDVWGAATDAITTAQTNTGTALIAVMVIVVAFFAFKIVKRVLGRG